MSLPQFFLKLTDAERSYDAGILAAYAFGGRTVDQESEWLEDLECSDGDAFKRGVADAQAGRCRILENKDDKRAIRYVWKKET